MYHNYYSVEQFMRERQRELLAEAQRARLVRSVSRRPVGRPTLLVRALAAVGRSMVIVGRRLEGRAAAAARAAVAARAAAAGMCEEQHSTVGG
jgi:hypothetical protein